MTNQEDCRNIPGELPPEAETIALKGEGFYPEAHSGISTEAMQKIIHDLRTHQIELEMQNHELRRLQSELDASRERYFDLYDLAPAGYCTLGKNGQILEINLTATILLGEPRKKLIQLPFSRFIFNEDQDIFYCAKKRLFELGGTQTCELRLKGKEGRYFWANMQITNALSRSDEPDQDHSATHEIRAVIVDITKRRQDEERQHIIDVQALQAQKMESLGTLVAGVAHNLNHVLAIVMGTASLREGMVSDPADREAYNNIGKVCSRGREVVKSLIHFSRPGIAIQVPIEMQDLVNEVCVLLGSTVKGRVQISKVSAEGLLWIKGDAGSISQALVNICLNSLDAMPDGGTLTFRTALPEDNLVEISIEDNGRGMAPEIMARAMEPFYTTKREGQGTGLGLSMTYGVVRAHGGTIEISSQPGVGTTVRMRFPRIASPVSGEFPHISHLGPPPTLASMRVFLVDDEEDVRLLMTRMLKKAGVSAVNTFSGGKEVLEALHSGELPDLIILDQNMPGLDGTQTLEGIRTWFPEMRVLISSGQPDIEQWDCFKRPKVAVISKPFTMDEIQAKLAEFAKEAGPTG